MNPVKASLIVLTALGLSACVYAAPPPPPGPPPVAYAAPCCYAYPQYPGYYYGPPAVDVGIGFGGGYRRGWGWRR